MTATERVVAVVLAAGLSRRFGADKLLHEVNGKPLGAHIADTLIAIALTHRAVVLPTGHPERRALFVARGFTTIENPNAESGMASSLALAAQHAIDLEAEAMLVCLADMPNITAAHLIALLNAGAGRDIVATLSAGTRGPPAIFARGVLPLLLDLTGDQGARYLLQAAATIEAVGRSRSRRRYARRPRLTAGRRATAVEEKACEFSRFRQGQEGLWFGSGCHCHLPSLRYLGPVRGEGRRWTINARNR